MRESDPREASAPADVDPDRIRLAGSRCLLWRTVQLRSAGFAFDDLADVLAPGLGAVPSDDEWLLAMRTGMDRAAALARDDRHRMALAWQNPAVLDLVVDRLAPAAEARRNMRRRRGEHTLMLYLQRYHTKNESIGFFGPIRWAWIGEDAPGVRAVPGPDVAGRHHVHLEDWAVDAIGEVLARDPRLAGRIPPSLAPQAQLRGRLVLRGDGAPVMLTPDEAVLVAECDGRRTVADLAARLGRTAADVERGVADLAVRGALVRRLEAPPDLHAERFLAADVRALAPADLRAEVDALLDDLERGRAAVAAAQESNELRAAISALGARFEAATDTPAHRTKAEAQKGRSLVVSIAERSLDVTFGESLVDGFAAPLALVMESARWYARRAQEAAEALLRDAYAELAGFYGPTAVPLGGFVTRLTGPGDWLDPVVDQLGERWLKALDLDLGARRVDRPYGSIAAVVRELFTASSPDFPAAWHHSPDVMMAARDVDAINRGDVDFVLGEIHAAMVTVDGQRNLQLSDDPGSVTRSIDRALRPGETMFVPLHARWPQRPLTGSTYLPPDAPSPTHRYISFGTRIGERLPAAPVIPAADIGITLGDDGVLAVLPGGERHPVSTLLSSFLGYAIVERFGLLPALPHTPRVVVDRLTVVRESWRIAAEEWADLTSLPEPETYRAFRRRADELGLPRHLFFRSRMRVKPIYLDVESPLLVAVFVRELRRAVSEGEDVTFQEMHPDPGNLWLVDREGRHYTSELRLTVADDRSAEGVRR